MSIKVKVNPHDTTESYCEITDLLDDYLEPNLKKIDWMKSYITHFEGDLKNGIYCIRVPGATRGCIHIQDGIVQQIQLYDDTAFSDKLGCYDRSKKQELLDKLNMFIGDVVE